MGSGILSALQQAHGGQRRRPCGGAWLDGLTRYLVAAAIGHTAWELLHLPLYTAWQMETHLLTALFLLRCIAGDILIALSVFIAALIVLNQRRWPEGRFVATAALTILFGLAYTVFSEWVHVHVFETWAYTAPMPTLPILGTGLSPLAQWLVVPALCLWWARPRDGDAHHPR
jgi:hypothetical protein